MLVEPNQFEELFDGALRDDLASSEDKKLVVFVSTGEADSVCATRILQVRVLRCSCPVAVGALFTERHKLGCSKRAIARFVCKMQFVGTHTSVITTLLTCASW